MQHVIVACIMLAIATSVGAASKHNDAVPGLESSEWNEKVCPKGVGVMADMLRLNPYDSNGMCFNFEGELIQLLNRTQALFSAKYTNDKTPLAFIDFGVESVPMGNLYNSLYSEKPLNYYQGVVKGKGHYSYITVSGMQKIIFSLAPVPKSKARIAWDNKQEKERGIREAEKVKKANERANAVQEWRKNNPTYSDLSNGLMWVRNGDIAGKGMQWDEAMKWVQNINYGGYSDWRLPTADELTALAQLGGNIPAEWFNINGFYNVFPYIYWTQDYKSHNAYIVNMGAKERSTVASPSNHFHVWPVRTIVKLDPKDAGEFYNRGNAYNNLKQFDQAIADYDMAIIHDPKYAAAFHNRGGAYLQLNKDLEACADLETACKLGECRGYKFAQEKKRCKLEQSASGGLMPNP